MVYYVAVVARFGSVFRVVVGTLLAQRSKGCAKFV
jgi:hypothetical protein